MQKKVLITNLSIYDFDGNIDNVIDRLNELKIRYECTHTELQVDVYRSWSEGDDPEVFLMGVPR